MRYYSGGRFHVEGENRCRGRDVGRGRPCPKKSFPPLRVLIVDDDPRILTVFAKELDAQLTISVCATAAGGEHALDTPSWRSHHIDVILLDISMPGLNGIQTARAIHRNLPDLPIVMFTAFSDERTLSEALTEGVKGFITKDESVEGVATALIRAKKGHVYHVRTPH